MLRVENVTHSFKNGNETTAVLHQIDFSVKKGEMVALLGSSGSGKSTMLNLMAGLMKPTEGHIYIADQDIVKMSENKLSEFRRKHIGFIFQAYELITSLTVRENVELPLVFQSVSPSIRKQKLWPCWKGSAFRIKLTCSLHSCLADSSSGSVLHVP